MSLALTISGLSKTYPNGVEALRDVSLTIPTGMFGLLGPNGAGKSTLMRTLATLQDADAGTVSLRIRTAAAPGNANSASPGGSAAANPQTSGDGTIDVLRDKAAVRRILGYLPQDFGVYPKVSAEDLLDHLATLKGLAERKTRRDVVAGLLRQTNLFDVRKKALGAFSGGMRQRFGIAQALLGDPRLIIVDEPTAGLDPEERVRFHNLLAEIGENVIVILSTHIVSDVSDLCAQMAIIDKGRVLLTGRPADLTRRLDGRVWQKAIARADLETTKADYAVISTRLVAGRTLVNVVGDARPGDGFAPVAATLEDVYFAAIAGRLDAPARALEPA
jgi:ABC-type multidrug transport system ATPase subunit